MLPQPLEVDVVHEGVSLLAPILIGLGALAAAILTAITANARLRRQLAHDRDLHLEQLQKDRELRQEQLMHDHELRQQQLDNDQELHRRQLAHDRSLRYREHVQLILDALVEDVQELGLDLHQYEKAIEVKLAERGTAGPEMPPPADLELTKESAAIYKSLTEARNAALRLGIRLGQNDDTFIKLAAFLRSAGAKMRVLEQGKRGAGEAGSISEDERLASRVDDELHQFLMECATWYRNLIADEQTQPAL